MKTWDISGMGGGYELTCQMILKNGLKFIEANPGLKYDFKTFQGVHGIISPENTNAKRLEEAMMNGIEDATGAMVHSIISILLFVNEKGWDKALSIIERDQPDRIYEFDGTINSVPQTELSIRMEGH